MFRCSYKLWPMSDTAAPTAFRSAAGACARRRRRRPTPGLPFEHSFIRLDRALRGAHGDACNPLWQCYRDLLHASGIRCVAAEHGTVTSRAYNLLVSRRWMLLVPRERELFDSISVNAPSASPARCSCVAENSWR